jgi:hypothetical protein
MGQVCDNSNIPLLPHSQSHTFSAIRGRLQKDIGISIAPWHIGILPHAAFSNQSDACRFACCHARTAHNASEVISAEEIQSKHMPAVLLAMLIMQSAGRQYTMQPDAFDSTITPGCQLPHLYPIEQHCTACAVQ